MRISDWSSDVCSSDLPLEPAHRAQADVQVEQLAQRDVERADAAADRRGQRALDSDQIIACGLHTAAGQPVAKGVVGLFAGINFQPANFALATVGLGHGGRSEEHTSELQSLMRISYAVFRLQKNTF